MSTEPDRGSTPPHLAPRSPPRRCRSTEVTSAHPRPDRRRPTSNTTHSCTSRGTQALAAAARVDGAVAAGECAAVAAGRRPAGAQGRLHHGRHADDVRLEDPCGLALAVRRDGDRAAARGGNPDPGQDQHGRVRDGVVHGELRVRPDPQPLGRRAGAGRLRRWQRGGARRVPGAAGHRLGHRRVDPPARRADRDRRREADLRHGVAVRADRVRVVAGPGRPVRAHGARHGAAAPGHRRARPEGLDVRRRRGARRGGRGAGRCRR